jgi:hypothetical protein
MGYTDQFEVTEPREIGVTKETIEGERFLSQWSSMKIREFWRYFFKGVDGEEFFDRETKKAKEKGRLSRIVFRYTFFESFVPTRFHSDMGFRPEGYHHSLDMPLYIKISFSGDQMLAGYAGGLDRDSIGHKSPSRGNFERLIELECEDLLEIYGVPITLERVKE